MKLQHTNLSFIRYFNRYAKQQIGKSHRFIEIVPFATTLNAKANLLLKIALFENFIDQYSLEKELFESGRYWVKQYANKFKTCKTV